MVGFIRREGRIVFMDNAALRVEKLHKRYPGFELIIDSLVLPRGNIMGLVGPNGAGKSTLLKTILNLVHPDRGTINILGYDYRRQEIEARQLLGYVPEEPRIYDEVTPNWLGHFAASYYRSWDADYYHRLLDKFKLEPNKKFANLSKGARVKLFLCLALAHRPELLLLDEPTAGLDPAVRYDFLAELLEVVQDENRAVLLSSHIVGDVERVADYISFLRQGSLLLCDQKDLIMDRWKRLALTIPTSDNSALLSCFRYHSLKDRQLQGVTDAYDQGLTDRLTALGAENILILPLSLEELTVILIREKPLW